MHVFTLENCFAHWFARFDVPGHVRMLQPKQQDAAEVAVLPVPLQCEFLPAQFEPVHASLRVWEVGRLPIQSFMYMQP